MLRVDRRRNQRHETGVSEFEQQWFVVAGGHAGVEFDVAEGAISGVEGVGVVGGGDGFEVVAAGLFLQQFDYFAVGCFELLLQFAVCLFELFELRVVFWIFVILLLLIDDQVGFGFVVFLSVDFFRILLSSGPVQRLLSQMFAQSQLLFLCKFILFQILLQICYSRLQLLTLIPSISKFLFASFISLIRYLQLVFQPVFGITYFPQFLLILPPLLPQSISFHFPLFLTLIADSFHLFLQPPMLFLHIFDLSLPFFNLIVLPLHIFFHLLPLLLHRPQLCVFGGEMHLQSLLLVQLCHLNQQLLLVDLETHHLLPQFRLVLGLEIKCAPQFLQLLPLNFEGFLIVGADFLAVEGQIQLLHYLFVLNFVELPRIGQLPLQLLQFGLQLQFNEVAPSFTLHKFLLQPLNFPIFLLDRFLVGPLHFCDKFDPDHILVEVGYDFDLKVLQFLLFHFYEGLQLLNLGGERVDVLVVFAHLQLVLLLQLVVQVVQVGVPLLQFLVLHPQV